MPADDDHWTWSSSPYANWWRVGSMDDVDNLGLSRVVPAPPGRLKLAMCVACNYGPVGYQKEDEQTIWLACDLLHQQDYSAANDHTDFASPDNFDMGMIQRMIASGICYTAPPTLG